MREEFTQKLTNAEFENEKLRQQLDKLNQENMKLNLVIFLIFLSFIWFVICYSIFY